MAKFLIAYDLTAEIINDSVLDNTFDKIRREIKRFLFSGYHGKEIHRTLWVGNFLYEHDKSSPPAKVVRLTIVRALKAKGFDAELIENHVRLFISVISEDPLETDYQNPVCDDKVRNNLKCFLTK